MTPRGDFARHESKKTKKGAKKVAAPTEFIPPPEVQVLPKGKKARPPEEQEE